MQPKDMPDPIKEWQLPSRPPKLKTDERPELRLLVEDEDGYFYSGEYDHETQEYRIWTKGYTGPDDQQILRELTPELIDEHLEPVLEVVDNPRAWMWVPRLN